MKTELTVGEIAKQINYPIHRVAYIIRTRRIKPVRKVGILRVFSTKAVNQIKTELEGIKHAQQ
jgi:predicted transcriptional regulator